MLARQFEQFIEERVTILTDSERIEGQMFHPGGTRLSDFLNASFQQESKFLKVKAPLVFCRRSNQELSKVPFLMVARDRIVILMAHSSIEDDEPDSAKSPAVPLSQSTPTRFLR